MHNRQLNRQWIGSQYINFQLQRCQRYYNCGYFFRLYFGCFDKGYDNFRDNQYYNCLGELAKKTFVLVYERLVLFN